MSRAGRSRIERIRQRVKGPVRRLLHGLGYEVIPLREDEAALVLNLLAAKEIEVVIDVGANQGQYAQRLRAGGFDGKILSFEPGREAFEYLGRAAARDPHWEVERLALGQKPGKLTLNLSANSVSSSLLNITQRHVDSAAQSVVVDRESVDVLPLDRVVSRSGRRTLLKIDTQGYELEVLRGLGEVVEDLELVQVELSLVRLYEGQPTYLEVLSELESLGFVPCLVLPGFNDAASGELLQMDVLARRSDESERP